MAATADPDVKVGLCIIPTREKRYKSLSGKLILHDGFPSFEDLWKERDDFDMFIIWNGMIQSEGSIQALKQYCLDHRKRLLYDTHKCSDNCDKNSKCKAKLKVSVIVDIDETTDECVDKDPDYEIIPKFENKTYMIAGSMYENLKSMASMQLGGVCFEDVPIEFKDCKLQSIYGNITYVSNGINCSIQ